MPCGTHTLPWASIRSQLRQAGFEKCFIGQEAQATNGALLDLPKGWQPHDTRQVLAVVSAEMGSERETTRLAALNWMTALLAKSRSTVRLVSVNASCIIFHFGCTLTSCHPSLLKQALFAPLTEQACSGSSADAGRYTSNEHGAQTSFLFCFLCFCALSTSLFCLLQAVPSILGRCSLARHLNRLRLKDCNA